MVNALIKVNKIKLYIYAYLLVFCTQMLIASIDVGTRNLGLSVYNSDRKIVVHMEIVDLSNTDKGTVRLCEPTLVYLVRHFVEKRRNIFEAVSICAIEKQMRRRMLAVQFILEACIAPLVDYVVQIPPQSVKRFIGTGCRGSHRANKKAAIAKFKSLIGKKQSEKLMKKFSKKMDDVADASLQAIYVAENFRKILTKWTKNRSVLTA